MVDKYITQYYGMTGSTGFDYVYSINNTPKNDSEFRLHSHEGYYEIYFFITGNVEFHIEGNVYLAHPHDVFISRPGDMHHNVFRGSENYERIVIFIKTDFFKKNHCETLEKFFLNWNPGTNCQLPAHLVEPTLYPLLMRMNHYLTAGAADIAKCALCEFLYELNQMDVCFLTPHPENEPIKQIILYINDHLTEDICLEQLSSAFYINKYHLCRKFKKITGYTVNGYLNHKRLLLVKEYHSKGQTLLEASMNAGFHSYTHFYRMYRREYGCKPSA